MAFWFFTTDGKTIYGIIHNEFHGNERTAVCKSGVFLRCWENSITAAISRNGGVTFARVPGAGGLIANLPYRYIGDQPHQFGYFNPTNIVFFESNYYFFVSFIDPMHKSSGVCLVRNENVADPTSWRGWDGSGFTVQFADPYISMDGNVDHHICSAVGANRLMFSLGSVTFFKPKKLFIMVMRRQRWEKTNDNSAPGVYFSTSPDLVRWSLPERILADADASNGANSVQFYPSMIDFSSGDINFQQTSIHPTLITIQFEMQHVNERRQLLAYELEIRASR